MSTKPNNLVPGHSARLMGVALLSIVLFIAAGCGSSAPPEVIRAVFRRTRALAEQVTDLLPQSGGPRLSMGMTDDFEIAIEEGATHVRVGRALFGERGL